MAAVVQDDPSSVPPNWSPALLYTNTIIWKDITNDTILTSYKNESNDANAFMKIILLSELKDALIENRIRRVTDEHEKNSSSEEVDESQEHHSDIQENKDNSADEQQIKVEKNTEQLENLKIEPQNDNQQDAQETDWEVEIDEAEYDLPFTSLSKQKLEVGCFLGEYFGSLMNEKEIEDKFGNIPYIKHFCVFLYENEKGRFFLNSFREGNDLRFVKRTKKNASTRSRLPNLRFQRIFLDGQLRLFVEVIRDVIYNDEFIIEDLYDIEPAVQTPPYELSKVKLADILNFRQVSQICLDRLPFKLQQQYVDYGKNLFGIVGIKKIEQKDHPCYEQYGLFAKKAIKKDSIYAEYTGKVVFRDDDQNIYEKEEVFASRYLVDYGNPHDNIEGIWIDAAKVGNETRYMNDAMGTGHFPNTFFKRAWVGGCMHVVCQALRDINIGDEILVEYGDNYWDNIHEDVNHAPDDAPQVDSSMPPLEDTK